MYIYVYIFQYMLTWNEYIYIQALNTLMPVRSTHPSRVSIITTPQIFGVICWSHSFRRQMIGTKMCRKNNYFDTRFIRLWRLSVALSPQRKKCHSPFGCPSSALRH